MSERPNLTIASIRWLNGEVSVALRGEARSGVAATFWGRGKCLPEAIAAAIDSIRHEARPRRGRPSKHRIVGRELLRVFYVPPPPVSRTASSGPAWNPFRSQVQSAPQIEGRTDSVL